MCNGMGMGIEISDRDFGIEWGERGIQCADVKLTGTLSSGGKRGETALSWRGLAEVFVFT